MNEFYNIQPFRAEPSPKRAPGHSQCQIVNSLKGNGKRIVFSKSLVDTLGLSETVHIGQLTERETAFLCIGAILPGTCKKYPLKAVSGGRKAVYTSALVTEISDFLKLDFSSRTSYSLYGCKLEEWEEHTIAFLSLEVMSDE